MVEAVNRLVGNRLAEGGEVFLPGVGSLYTDRWGARRISPRKIEPPRHFVAFSSQERGVSLVGEIARTAQCDQTQAQDIYNRWLSVVQHDNTLCIEGVGELKVKSFVLDPAFDKLLNPQGHQPIKIKSSGSDWVLWVGVVAIVVTAVIVGTQFLPVETNKNLLSWMQTEESVQVKPLSGEAAMPTPVEASQPAAESQVTEESTTLPQTTDPSSAPQAADATHADASAAGVQTNTPNAAGMPANAQNAAATTHASGTSGAQPSSTTSSSAPNVSENADTPESIVAGRKYVVMGVYSSPANAARAVAEAAAKNIRMECRVYRFGTKYMVSVFDSTNAENCERFIRENNVDYPGLWTYVAR